MALWDWMKSAGGRLGILRFVSTVGLAPAAKVPTRVVTLDELTIEINRGQVDALAGLPEEVSQSLERVFEAAGIQSPAHGWTIQRLRARLAAEDLKALPRQETQKVVLHMLAAEQAHVQDVVRDAVARDRALDAFEISVEAKMRARAADRKARMLEIESRVRELQEDMDRLRRDAQADEAGWQAWHRRKVACEKEMAWALSFLLDESVVSIDTDPPADLGSSL